jgi:hypothetical protein
MGTDVTVDSLDAALASRDQAGSGNSPDYGVVGCGAPRFLAFKPWIANDFDLHLVLQTEHVSPLLIEMLSTDGKVLHSEVQRVSAEAPNVDIVDVRFPYAAIGTDRETAQKTTYVLRLTQQGAPCGPLRFSVSFPEDPQPY